MVKGLSSLFLVFVLTVVVFAPGVVSVADAQDRGLSLSVTPPLYQLNLSPGENWTGSLRLVNTNPYEITLYASPVTFTSNNDRGHPEFVPVLDGAEDDEYSPGNWIEIAGDPINIPRETSREIEFTVRVPENAGPGGHYAAILVGTNPLDSETGGVAVRVAGFVSSLVFISVKGDVVQSGFIREFTTDRAWTDTPDIDFSLRFENTGNVHIRPEGEIVIYNMWGKERGKIPINQKTHFGNVLPETVRNFSFNWKGEENFFETGRYKAILSLNYGDGMVHSASAETSFWVIPVVPVLSLAGAFLVFAFLLVFVVRAYVRRVVRASERRLASTEGEATGPFAGLGVLADPIKEEVVDLRNFRKEKSEPETSEPSVGFGFLSGFTAKMKPYFAVISILALFASSAVVAVYFKEVLLSERNFEIVVVDGDRTFPIAGTASDVRSEPPSVTILSGEENSASASLVASTLEQAGFLVASFGNTADEAEGIVIKYPPGMLSEASSAKDALGEEAEMVEDATASGIIIIAP